MPTAQDVEAYSFDAGGWVLLRGALSPAEVNAARSGAAALAALASHPLLTHHLRTIMSFGPPPDADATVYKMDSPPSLVSPGDEGLRGGAWCADGSFFSGHGYTARAGQRLCLATRAFWALTATDELSVVPGSHNSWLAPPTGLTEGDIEDVSVRLSLLPGDLVIAATALLWTFGGGSGELAAAEFSHPGVRPADPAAAQAVTQPDHSGPIPDWVEALTPTQRAMTGWGTTPAPLLSDGHRTWLGEDDAPPDQPAVLTASAENGNGSIDPVDVWKWDLQGHFVVKGRLSPLFLRFSIGKCRNCPFFRACE